MDVFTSLFGGFVPSMLGAVVTFLVNLLVGGLGIYVGAQLVVGEGDFWTAVWTALVAAVATAVVAVFVGWIPLIGFLVSLVVYLGVIKLFYDGNWVEAAAIALIAWVASTVVRALLGGLPFL